MWPSFTAKPSLRHHAWWSEYEMSRQAPHVNAICVLLSLAFLISHVESFLKAQMCFFLLFAALLVL